MTQTAYWRNHLGAERAARGLTREQMAERSGIDLRLYVEFEEGRLVPTFQEFERIRSSLDDIDPSLLYPAGRGGNSIGDRRNWEDRFDSKRYYDSLAEASHLLVAPDEVLWLDRVSAPDRQVEVFFNMSCGTQMVPHLMLDSAAVLRALGVSFSSGAGAAYCCGSYLNVKGKFDSFSRVNAANTTRSVSWGAATAVHLCTQCVNTFSRMSRRRAFDTGEPEPLRHVQLLRFVDERLEELGDRIPWQKEVKAKVLVHGHQNWSHIHDIAKRDVGKVAARIPGVEVVGVLDRTFLDSATGYCDVPGDGKRPPPRNRAEAEQYRIELAKLVESWEADTISPQHQDCLRTWEPFASERVRVRHVMSLLAEALGVGHPDRYLAASRLGDTHAIVDQTRPIWTAWGMPEERAYETARTMFDPVYQTAGTCQGCGRGPGERCGNSGSELIGIDVLKGTV
jgi:Fe-S oxidoreductase